MKEDAKERFLQDVGISGLPYPMKVSSRDNADGQQTVANISISARIMQKFEARWIDRFMQVVHRHEGHIGTSTMKANILEYMEALKATKVKIEFQYPFFMEKATPVSKEKCLVCYTCTHIASVSTAEKKPKVSVRVTVPCMTTYPVSGVDRPGGLFAQMSMVEVEAESEKDLYPEDLVDMVDRHALVPVYSFLTEADQEYVIQKAHQEEKTSVVMVDEIKKDLSRMRGIEDYSVSASNYGMLHSHSTSINTAKSMWIPFS